MALLHYANLEEHRPDILLQKTFNGLQDFYKFLENTKQYLESSSAVKRLAWELIDKELPSVRGENDERVWVQLKEVDFYSDDTIFRNFLDENNKEVYEANNADWVNVASPAIECPKCRQKNGKPKLAYQTKEHALEVASQAKTNLNVYECDGGYGWHLTKQYANNRIQFSQNKQIAILDRNPESEQLLLDRKPREPFIVLRPNTYTLRCQLTSIKTLQDAPRSSHRPLLRLFESRGHAKWEGVSSSLQSSIKKWFVLTDVERPGTSEQRTFVVKAMNSPDFSFLEGPPGSGKTTAILELIIQLALQGKRVLLCASTHVAVDNVLERILKEDSEIKDVIIPIRIGCKSNISEEVKSCQLEMFLATERDRLMKELKEIEHLSDAQIELIEQLHKGNQTIQRMVLDGANLICGTTIGILQHPAIKDKSDSNPQFDYMIIDEASKTTFQEFLVPALLAKKWVLVGDQKQLSPYVDDESTAINIAPCLSAEYKRNACLDVFNSSSSVGLNNRKTSLIVDDNKDVQIYYENQARSKGVLVAQPTASKESVSYASIIVGDKEFLSENQSALPLSITKIRGNLNDIPMIVINRRNAKVAKLQYRLSESKWEDEIAWRLSRLYEQRHNLGASESNSSTSMRLKRQIDALLPFDSKQERESVFDKIDRVRRVALPSVLESLQSGFERPIGQREGTALSDGLPDDVFSDRAVKLTYQHRMHPDIANFSHRKVYQEKSLFTPPFMTQKRTWTYKSDRRRATWVDIKTGNGLKGGNKNLKEALAVMKELKEFDCWASQNDREDGKPWEIAILSFYRAQEKEIRQKLRKWTGNHRAFRHFTPGGKRTQHLSIQVCTVDRFQGHEADLVLLSFSNSHPTSFLESPNRLNVAITRARYGLVVFGDRNAMQGATGVLSELPREMSWSMTVEE